MEQMGNGIHIVGGSYVNSFVVDGDQGVVLIDTGLPKKEGLITSALQEVGRDITDVVAIVLTHSHTDHIGGAAALKVASSATVIAPAADTPAIEGRAPIPAPPMLPGPLGIMTRLLPKPAPVTVDRQVGADDGEGMPEDIIVIDTPGHTPGHTSYLLDRGGGVLFVGDAAVAGKDGTVGRGFMNRGGGDTIAASIRNLATHRFETAVFAHSGPITSGAGAAFRAF